MAAAAAGLMIGGGIIQALGARQQGKAAEALGKYKVALARQDAANVTRTAAEEQKIRRMELVKTLARNREQTAASGLMFAGTPAEHELDVINDYAYDIARIGYEGESQARRYDQTAEIYKMEAESAQRASKIGMWSALFGAGSQAASTLALDKIYRQRKY